MFDSLIQVDVRRTVSSLALSLLQSRASDDDIVKTGLAVQRAVAQFRRLRPEAVPVVQAIGLLSLGEVVPVDDFALARHLLTSDLELVAVLNRIARGVPPLLAYVCIVCLGEDSLGNFDLRAAFHFVESESAHEVSQIRSRVVALADMARHGEKFAQNRKTGVVAPLTKAIQQALRRDPNASAKDIWEALKARPPKNHAFRESPRLGKYIEVDQKAGVPKSIAWSTFNNRVSQEKVRQRK